MAEERESIKALDEFLRLVREELFTIIDKRLGDLPSELRGHAKDSWPEIDVRIKEAREQLRGVSEKRLGELGLTGSSLKLKIQGFMLARASGRMRRIFDWINTILGSLSGALPILEPVEEFKEALEHSLPL